MTARNRGAGAAAAQPHNGNDASRWHARLPMSSSLQNCCARTWDFFTISRMGILYVEPRTGILLFTAQQFGAPEGDLDTREWLSRTCRHAAAIRCGVKIDAVSLFPVHQKRGKRRYSPHFSGRSRPGQRCLLGLRRAKDPVARRGAGGFGPDRRREERGRIAFRAMTAELREDEALQHRLRNRSSSSTRRRWGVV